MANALKPTDEFDAVRMIVEILKDLTAEEQSRVVRWAQEKLGFANTPSSGSLSFTGIAPTVTVGAPRTTSDIASFMASKQPSNDVQFATAVAYYYAFEAPQGRAAPEIDSSALQNATRLAGRPRLQNPIKTLHNAVARGYLDKGSGKGLFSINTVGENLVAMSLPTGEAPQKSKRAKKKAVRKK